MTPGRRQAAAKDRAYEHVKRAVLSATLAGGELISEGEIASELGMSRTPVREAFLQLEAEGLLRLYPKRGALVVPVSSEEIEAVIETRWVVERFGIEKSLALGTDLSAAFERSLAEQRAAADAEDARRFAEADREFHRIPVAAAGNPIVTSLYDSLRDRQQRMVRAMIAVDWSRVRPIVEQHAELAAAIAGGRRAESERLLRSHLDGTLAALRRGGMAP